MKEENKKHTAEALLLFQLFENALKQLLSEARKGKIDKIEDIYFHVEPSNQVTALVFIKACKLHGIETYLDLEGLTFDQRVHLSATFFDHNKVAAIEGKINNG